MEKWWSSFQTTIKTYGLIFIPFLKVCVREYAFSPPPLSLFRCVIDYPGIPAESSGLLRGGDFCLVKGGKKERRSYTNRTEKETQLRRRKFRCLSVCRLLSPARARRPPYGQAYRNFSVCRREGGGEPWQLENRGRSQTFRKKRAKIKARNPQSRASHLTAANSFNFEHDMFLLRNVQISLYGFHFFL
jgi:hypothetical protein